MSTPQNVIRFPHKPRQHDCQGESVRSPDSGMNLDELRAQQARERLIHRAKEELRNWRDATDAVLAIEGIEGDPAETMIKYIQDRRRSSS